MMKRRFVGKVSDDNPIEGLIRLIAKMKGVNPSAIRFPDEMIDSIKQQQNERLAIRNIIGQFYDELKSQNTKDSNKKAQELIDLGKFIYFLSSENKIKIVQCTEQPDFIIKYKNELIGVEHTGVYDEEVVAEIKTIKKIIRKCQEKLENEHTEITGLYNIIVIPTKLKGQLPFKYSEIIQNICDCVVAKHRNLDVPKPDFIEDITQTPHQIIELTLGENYWLAELTSDSIAKTIAKKETKIATYKSQKGLSKCWLLIVIDGVSSASSFNIQLGNLPQLQTSFDMIYIFDNFKGLIIKMGDNITHPN